MKIEGFCVLGKEGVCYAWDIFKKRENKNKRMWEVIHYKLQISSYN